MQIKLIKQTANLTVMKRSADRPSFMGWLTHIGVGRPPLCGPFWPNFVDVDHYVVLHMFGIKFRSLSFGLKCSLPHTCFLYSFYAQKCGDKMYTYIYDIYNIKIIALTSYKSALLQFRFNKQTSTPIKLNKLNLIKPN